MISFFQSLPRACELILNSTLRLSHISKELPCIWTYIFDFIFTPYTLSDITLPFIQTSSGTRNTVPCDQPRLDSSPSSLKLGAFACKQLLLLSLSVPSPLSIFLPRCLNQKEGVILKKTCASRTSCSQILNI